LTQTHEFRGSVRSVCSHDNVLANQQNAHLIQTLNVTRVRWLGQKSRNSRQRSADRPAWRCLFRNMNMKMNMLLFVRISLDSIVSHIW